jgi:16S rRNA (guanine527-N7)-methyltransferase
MDTLFDSFPGLTERQQAQFRRMPALYADWNARINVISRRDMDQLPTRHILHSLAIAKIVTFGPGCRVLDVGTGGGFPGIPLAVLFPEAQFTLVDSIGKKIRVVEGVAQELGLQNVTAVNGRAEALRERFDFVVTRAVADLSTLVSWSWNRIVPGGTTTPSNGLFCLKGGDPNAELGAELAAARKPYALYPIAEMFADPFFETKFVVYLPR